MNYTLIILGTILVIVLVILYFKSGSSSITTQLYLKGSTATIPMNTLSNPSSAQYTYSMWVCVNNLNNSDTYLFSIVDSSTSSPKTFFQLYIDSTNNLKYGITNNSTGETLATANAKLANDTTIMTNFPLQKWVFVLISVDNGTVIDIYINGKLVKSQNATIKPPTDKCTINYGVSDAYVSKFKRTTTATDPTSVWSQYMQGNGGSYFSSLFSSFGMNVVVTKDQLDYNKVTLF